VFTHPQVRNSPEYRYLTQAMHDNTELWNKERAALKAQCSKQMQQMSAERAEIYELRRVS
jgi:hypothetical protein